MNHRRGRNSPMWPDARLLERTLFRLTERADGSQVERFVSYDTERNILRAANGGP